MTRKERTWLNEYLQCWNATEAARRAGYKWPNKQGFQKLEKFRDVISERLRANAMDADEALARLADMARADIGEFVGDHGAIDWAAVKRKGHLVKRISHTAGRNSSVELHDAQAALIQIVRGLGIFKELGDEDRPLNIRFGIDVRERLVSRIARLAALDDTDTAAGESDS